MDEVRKYDTLIIVGETGSGKTTREYIDIIVNMVFFLWAAMCSYVPCLA